MGKAGPLLWLAPSLEAQVGPCRLGAVSLHKKIRVCRRRAGAEQEWGVAPELEGRVGLRLDAGSWTGCQRRRSAGADSEPENQLL